MKTVTRKFKTASLAFTLIELSTIIVLLSILYIMAAPRFFKSPAYQQAYFYNTVLNSLRYAQRLAIYGGCHIQVGFTSTTVTLLKRSSCTTGSFNVNVRDPASGSSSYVQTAPGTVTQSFSDSAIYFDTAGIAHRSSDASITNYTVNVGGKTMNIIGQTGYAYDPST